MAKILWLDTETGGLHPGIHALLELGMLVEIDGEVVEECLLQIKPFPDDEVNVTALEKNGITQPEMEGFLEPRDGFKAMHRILDKYVNKYDPNDKFLPAGYNVGFDLLFIESFCKKNAYNYLYSYMSHDTIDLLPVVRYLVGKGFLQIENFQLETVCTYFGVRPGAHRALADATATRKLSMVVDQWMKAGLVRDYGPPEQEFCVQKGQ